MLSGQSHLISCCITLTVIVSVGTVELQKVHLYSRAASSARRLQPGQVLAPARAQRGRTSGQALERRWSPRLKTGPWRAHAGWRGADQPAQTACARCRRRPCPRPHPGQAYSLLVHAHCPHVCNALARVDDPHTAVWP